MADDGEEKARARRSSKRVKAAAAAKDTTGGGGAALSSSAANGKGRAAASSAAASSAGAAREERKSKPTKVLVDFHKLEMLSLLKYRKHFKLPTRPNANKGELISHVKKHFAKSHGLVDAEVLSAFLYANQKYNSLFSSQAQANMAAAHDRPEAVDS